jgi:hypothetical protein
MYRPERPQQRQRHATQGDGDEDADQRGVRRDTQGRDDLQADDRPERGTHDEQHQRGRLEGARVPGRL